MIFHLSLSDSKSPQVSRTRLSILAVLSNAVVWIVSTRPLTSKSSRPFNNPLVTVLLLLLLNRNSFLKPYNCVQIIVLRIVTRNSYCLCLILFRFFPKSEHLSSLLIRQGIGQVNFSLKSFCK